MRKLLTLLLCLLAAAAVAGDDFYAYHTKVQHSATDYLGKYADLIVVTAGGKLEFTRRTGYLPLWRTEAGSYLVDDLFPGRDPDYEFNYNYVRLMEDSPGKIVVHWRYFKDIETLERANQELNSLHPHGFQGAIHEFFTIFPDGRVIRKVLESNENTRISDWRSNRLTTIQELKLNAGGIDHGKVQWGRPPRGERRPVEGNPVLEPEGIPDPIHYWSFDEGLERHEDFVEDAVTEEEGFIPGLMTLFKKGVSGTGLAFDGYYTGVEMGSESGSGMEKGFTIGAWLALDVYPYNDAPIIHSSEGFGEKGWYFGVDAYGHLFFRMNGETVKTNEVLPLYTWTHASVSVDENSMILLIDGKKAASARTGEMMIPDLPVTIGLNTEMGRCTDFVRTNDQNLLFIFGIQGMLDEIRIYQGALKPAVIKKCYEALLPKDRLSPIKAAVLPGEMGTSETFGAKYKTLEFHELWDNMWRVPDGADVVVKFDKNPCSVIFWRGTNYSANWVADNNRWMSDQSSEIGTKHGCSEHMADKQLRHAYSRIIENTPARVVIHWRYPCVDVSYYCADRRNWSDEYHTIFPDGTGVRHVNWNKVYGQPGFQDIQFFTNPGETALDVVDIQAVTLANTKGEKFDMLWKAPNIIPRNPIKDATIQYLNSKSKYKIYALYQGGSLGAWGEQEQSRYTDDPFAGPWNHWPVYFVPSDGRFAIAHDRVTHFALGANDEAPEHGSVVHYGFTDQDILSLVPRTRYWQNPPQVVKSSGITAIEFDKTQKSYVFKMEKDKMSFTINASEEQPIVNPCFEIRNWGGGKAAIRLNGKAVKPGSGFRQGVMRDVDGSQTLVVWLEMTADTKTTFTLE